MDPLSITATCVGLLGTIAKTSFAVTGFVREVRGARSDLDSVSRELLSLKTVLELLADDASNPTNDSLPETLQKQIAGIITNCGGVVGEIEKILRGHEGNRLNKAAMWAIDGKNDMAKLRSSLEAHKSALEIALDMVTMTLAIDIRADTKEIRSDTSAIKEDTAQILAEIARLQQKIPQDPTERNTTGFILERYLDNLTTYAESVCDTSPDYDFDIVTPGVSYDNQESGNSQQSKENSNSLQDVTLLGTTDNSVDLGKQPDIVRDFTVKPLNLPMGKLKATTSIHEQEIGKTGDSRENRLQEPQEAEDLEVSRRGEEMVQNIVLPIFLAAHHRRTVNEYHGLHHSVVPREDQEPCEEQQYPVTYGKASDSGEIKITSGQFILDMPIPPRLLCQVPHSRPPGRDEFTHARYSALTCSPNEFKDSSFLLRPQLFLQPRKLEIMLTVTLPAISHDNSNKEATTLCRTLNSIIDCVQAMNGFWGSGSWRRFIVMIMCTRTISPVTRAMLGEMGIYPSWTEFLKNTKADVGKLETFPRSVNNVPVQAHCFEYTTQFKPKNASDWTGHSTPMDPSEAAVQVVVCLQVNGAVSPAPNEPRISWPEAFSRQLKPRAFVEVEWGRKVRHPKLSKIWEASLSSSPSLPTQVFHYKDKTPRSSPQDLLQQSGSSLKP